MARKYTRDNRGRFASGGGGATARGGRLRTASGNKRKTQTMKAGGAGGAGVMKGRVARDPGAMAKAGKSQKPAKQSKRPNNKFFADKAASLTPQNVERRRMQAEMARPMQFFKGKVGGKAEREFRDRLGEASYRRQQRSLGVAIEAKRFLGAAAQFQSEFTTRPKWKTVSNPSPRNPAWTHSDTSAWKGYKGKGGRRAN